MWQSLAMFAPVGIEPSVFYAVFFVIFAIILSTLKKVPILGATTGDYRIHLVISLVMSYFTATSAFATVLITSLFPRIGIVILLGILALIVTSFMGAGDSLQGISKGLMIFLFGWAVWNSWSFATIEAFGYKPTFLNISAQDWPQIILLLVLAWIFLYLIGGGKPPAGWSDIWKPPWAR